MLSGLLPRLVRTPSFGMALLYAAVLAASVTIIGAIAYWTVETSLERQMTARIEAEVGLLKEELRSEGDAELIEEVQRRDSVLGLDYLLVDAKGDHIAGNLPVDPTRLGWSDISLPVKRPGAGTERTFHVHTVQLDNGMRLSVAGRLWIDKGHAPRVARSWCLEFVRLHLAERYGGIAAEPRILKRVDTIRTTAEAIIGGDLDSRIPLRGTNDNFDLLSCTLNRMLDRIQTLMGGASHMANDIAHALRTPLSRLKQKLEAAQKSAAGNPDCESAIDAVQLETENSENLFSAPAHLANRSGRASQSGSVKST